MKESDAQSPVTHEELLSRIKDFEHRIPALQCRAVPTSFNPEDTALCVFPASSAWKWSSLEKFLKSTGSRGVLSRVPLFWQLESPLHAVCVETHAIFFLNDVANMPLGAAALRGMYMDTVLTDSKDAAAFATFLGTSNTKPRTWFIVHSVFEDSWAIPELSSASIIGHDVHLFPGVPLLEQCEVIVEKRRLLFHFADTFTYEQSNNSLLVTSTGDTPLPIERYRLPLKLQEHGQCSCGKTLFART